MANVSKVAGLKPVGYLNGSPWNGQARKYYVPATNATAIYVGDPVTLTGDGDTNGVPGVVTGAAGAAIIGVVVGVVVADAGVSLQGTTIDLTRRSLPVSTAGYVLVADDPNIIFEVEEGVSGGAGTALTSAAIGLNANLVLKAAPTATYQDSGWVVDNSTEAATATLNVKLLGLAQREDNAFGAAAKWLVKINNHVYGASTGTAGI